MSNISLGIDISKSDISVALLKEKRTFKSKFANDDSGFRKLNQWLQKIQAPDVKIAMEATGHYYVPLADFLHKKKYATYVINPFCIKSFANTRLSRNKTDEADAVIIAQYIKQNEARLYKPVSKIIRELRQLDKCLESIKADRAAAKTRLKEEKYLTRKVVKVWQNIIKELDNQIEVIEKEMLQLINSDKQLSQHYKNLQTIPGIGITTAITILALVPDISEFSEARQLAVFVGLTPQQRSSGSSVRGKARLSKIGSARLRKAIYFPAMSAKKHNLIVKGFCENLKKKHPMVVVCAAMRKLMHIVFAILKHKVVFNPLINSQI